MLTTESIHPVKITSVFLCFYRYNNADVFSASKETCLNKELEGPQPRLNVHITVGTRHPNTETVSLKYNIQFNLQGLHNVFRGNVGSDHPCAALTDNLRLPIIDYL